MSITEYQIKSMIIGHAVGDALGVPVEFKSREELKKDPVTDMREFGQHKQPRGAWSDDTAMSLCSLESIVRLNKIDYEDIQNNHCRWLFDHKFTATGNVFDVGTVARRALLNYKSDPITVAVRGKPIATSCGLTEEGSNGNGSLMRIDPITLYLLKDHKDLTEYDLIVIQNVSSLTHAHRISKVCCCIYAFIVAELLHEGSIQEALNKASYLLGLQASDILWRLGDVDSFKQTPERDISSSGFVVSTLEAALWCFLNTNSYEECVLKAVNLGDDTDTVSAIAGSLAGLKYGLDSIPKIWVRSLKRLNYIKDLCNSFYRTINTGGDDIDNAYKI